MSKPLNRRRFLETSAALAGTVAGGAFPAPGWSNTKSPNEKLNIAASIGHHNEWIEACKTGSPTTCNFDYSGALSEAVLLGNVAYRAGKKLQWDAENLKAVNCPEADQYVRREYRDGWTL